MQVKFVCYTCGSQISSGGLCSWDCEEDVVPKEQRALYQLHVEEQISFREEAEYFAPVVNGDLASAMEQIVEMRKDARDSGK